MADKDNVALSSRVRLARNVAGTPFPGRMSLEDLDRICTLATESFAGADFEMIPVEDLPSANRHSYVEKHLASPALMENDHGMLIISRDETIAIMIGEEDHIRIQCIMPGVSLCGALATAQEVNSMLEKHMHFAYDDTLGYLTTCPTNVGTGVRASVMLHLPALTMTGQMGEIQRALHGNGMAVRGIYGEGSNAMGSIFQISNRITIGATEEQLAEGVSRTVAEIVKKENETCRLFNETAPISLEDGIFRSFGVMSNARRVELSEFMRMWSGVMLGCNLGWIDLDTSLMVSLLTDAQNGQITLKHGPGNVDAVRADMCRAVLAHGKITK